MISVTAHIGTHNLHVSMVGMQVQRLYFVKAQFQEGGVSVMKHKWEGGVI